MFACKTDFLIYVLFILLGILLIFVALIYMDLKNRIDSAEENLENLIGELLVEKEELGSDESNVVLTETWQINSDNGNVSGEDLKDILKEILEKKYGERKDNN